MSSISKLKEMIKTPASKEYFKKFGMPKKGHAIKKALNKAK